MKIKVKLEPGATKPSYAHPWDGGMDLYASERKVVRANDWAAIETGVHIAIPEGYVGVCASKSGLMANHGLTCRGIIDSHFVGAMKAIVFNHSGKDYIFEKGDKVTQMLIMRCEHPELELVDELEDTDRGDCGFGSTGR